ncbi:hypothetical protein JCM11641_003006 [Rhodosporidiobolus odoratus]
MLRRFPARKSSSRPLPFSFYSTELNYHQAPLNLRLYFPKAKESGAELWTNAELLASVSPYFQDLLSSAFEEASSPHRGKHPRRSSASGVGTSSNAPDGEDFEDSDDESGAFLFSTAPRPVSEPCDDPSYRHVTPTQTAFTTYRSPHLSADELYAFSPSQVLPRVICQRNQAYSQRLPQEAYHRDPATPLRCLSQICFPPRSPSPAPRPSEALPRRLLLVSHRLRRRVRALQQHLDRLRRGPPHRLEFCKKNWATIKVSDGWKEMMDKHKRNEMPQCGAVLAELLEMVGMKRYRRWQFRLSQEQSPSRLV